MNRLPIRWMHIHAMVREARHCVALLGLTCSTADKPPVPSGADQPGVLVLQNASKSFVESDFRRLVPSGQHIKGWKGEGDILKSIPSPRPLMFIPTFYSSMSPCSQLAPVIPGRDPQTLSPLGFYYLVFSSASSAKTFRDHVMRLHLLARTHTPRSLNAPIPPPPGYLINGEDVYASLQTYALVPPSQTLALRPLHPPLSRSVQHLIDRGAYGRIVTGHDTNARTAMLHIEGGHHHFTTNDIRKMIETDGKSAGRNMRWKVAGSLHVAITEVDAPPATAEDDETVTGLVVDGEVTAEEEAWQGKGRRWPVKWLIRFEDEAEARRFARRWHKRNMPGSEDDADGLLPILNVEVV